MGKFETESLRYIVVRQGLASATRILEDPKSSSARWGAVATPDTVLSEIMSYNMVRRVVAIQAVGGQRWGSTV